MKNQTMNQIWRTTTVVPTCVVGMGEVRLDAVAYASDLATFKRHANAIKATPATGFHPWSPPVT